MQIEWTHHEKLPLYMGKSPTYPGTFCIFYDDVMYWDSFSGLSPTQDLEAIKAKAQEIHDSYK
jgi:hypothetical protein